MSDRKSMPTSDEFENFDIDAYYARKALRHDRPWAFDIIRVLWGNRSSVSVKRLCGDVWKLRNPSDLPMPKDFGRTIQSVLNKHTRQSSEWSGKREDDLFYSPQGKGSGTWAVHQDRAVEWLKSHELPDV